jgi:hypothetical protein
MEEVTVLERFGLSFADRRWQQRRRQLALGGLSAVVMIEDGEASELGKLGS